MVKPTGKCKKLRAEPGYADLIGAGLTRNPRML